MKKKLLFAFVALLTTASAWAADGDVFTAKTVEGVDMTFKVISETDKTCQVGRGPFLTSAINWKTTGAITIPSTAGGYTVITIGDWAFGSCNTLTSINIPDGITEIGKNAFNACRGLTSIIIPESVTSIGEAAFAGCRGLTSITIPNSVTSIGSFAFSSCSGLVSINLSESMTSIDEYTFQQCTGLTSITIPNSVTDIGKFAFVRCTSLANIYISESVTSISSTSFDECSGLTNITVDADNKIFDSRGDCNAIIETATNTLLHGCSSTVIPNDVTSIGDYAFIYLTGLTSISIPSSVTSISSNSFSYCSGLTNITVDVDNKIFDSRGDCNAIIETATNTLLHGCSSTVIPNDVTSIANYAFLGCSGLTNITIPSNITSIGYFAFSGCSGLKNITVDSDNKIFDSHDDCNAIIETATNKLLYGCSSTIIPSDVTSIGIGAFQECTGLTSIIIPENVTSIDRQAFRDCSSLTSVTIPNSVTRIDDDAFRWCEKLITLISYIEEPFSPFFYSSFSTYSSSTLYVPVGTKTKYEAADGWKNFKKIVEFSNASVKLTKEMETFAYVLPLDFTTPVSGLKAYTVKEVSDGKAVLEEVTGAVPAGTGLILKGTAGDTYELPYATKAPLPVENKLVGVLADTEIGGNDVDYILKNGKFVKAVAGTLKAGKAYLKLDAALAREIIEIDGETTGISLVENGKRETENVFDLQGRRVSKPSKGMYIVNGKKVVMN